MNNPQYVDDGRMRQVDSLRQAFPTLKELNKGILYEIPLVLPSRTALTLRISLPPTFPKITGPVIQVYPPVQHRLINQQMYIIPQAHENLQKWNYTTSNLGRTMLEIVQKLLQEPPVLAPLPPSYPSTPQINFPIPQEQPSIPFVTHTPQPVVPSNFPQLESKTISELSQMMNDEYEFNKFFEELPQVSNMVKVRDDLRNNNQELAKKTLAQENDIELLKQEIKSSAEIIEQQKLAFQTRSTRQQEIINQYSTSNLIDGLTKASQDAERESDDIATRFLNRQMELKDFVKEFMEKRKLYHLRSAKRESLMMINR